MQQLLKETYVLIRSYTWRSMVVNNLPESKLKICYTLTEEQHLVLVRASTASYLGGRMD